MSVMTLTDDAPSTQSSAPPVETLHCPYCGSPLEQIHLAPSSSSGSQLGEYAVWQCGCAKYPVVEGIPILQHLPGLDRVIDYVRQGELDRALLQTMNVFRVTWAHRSRWHQLRFHLDCRRLLAQSSATFEDAIELVRKPKGFGDYLFHRYANPSFLTDMVLMPVMGAFLARRPGARVLDLACGAGHSSFLLTHWFSDAAIVSADQDFISLYLAQRFLAPTATAVCFDVEAPSPFPDGYFDAVHCLDAFHYFKAKRAILSEMRRTTKSGALWLFPHLHNALAENITAGIPLSPDGYARCFEFLDAVLFDEADLRQGIMADGARDWFGEVGRDLSRAASLALVGGGAAAIRDRRPLESWLARNRRSLKVNPIYQATWNGGTLRLTRRWPNEVLHRECLEAESILPQSCDVPQAELVMLLKNDAAVSDEIVDKLLRRFVLVPLAPGYRRQDPTGRLH
jgi:SAM-dependent methyltransferase